MAQLSKASLAYMMWRQCPAQWRDFLPALAVELAEGMSVEQLRRLMFNVGGRMAGSYLPAATDSLEDLEDSFNDIWARMEWGYASISEQDDYVSIAHHCAPLRVAFGAESLVWSVSLLEGAYACWFDTIGAGNDLILRQVSEPEGGDDTVEFRLGQLHVVGPIAAARAVPG